MQPEPLLVFVPGLAPKPAPDVHREALRRCLVAGLRAADAEVAHAFEAHPGAFDLVSWTYDFYGEHRDLAGDRANIEALLRKTAADDRDRADAQSWRRRLLRGAYRIADRLPFLIPQLASEKMARHLKDVRRYVQNRDEVAETTRRHLKIPLRMAAAGGRPVLVIAHSMGSVIAWDALWQLSRDDHYSGRIGLFLTLGSPLGQHYIKRRLLGARESGTARYPTVIDRWVNMAAVGELTALNRQLAGDFHDMQEVGLVESIEDIETWNWYRDGRTLNVHAEYGYLANADVAGVIARWWRSVSSLPGRGSDG